MSIEADINSMTNEQRRQLSVDISASHANSTISYAVSATQASIVAITDAAICSAQNGVDVEGFIENIIIGKPPK